MARLTTEYSQKIPGSTGNYRWPVVFDDSFGGFVGISQEIAGGTERVLLSSRQVRALFQFLKRVKSRALIGMK